MNLYNSQNQQIEPFTVGDKDVTLFVGGITPYNTAHLGHAFTYCVADVLMRYLEMQGYHVTFVQNSGQPLPKDRQELNNKQTYYVSEDMQALNVRLPDIAHFDLSETVDIQISEAHEVGTEQRPFSRFWLHTTLVAHKGEKMSKSLGNLVLVRDLLQYHTVDALR
ncbi:MAG: class I tRNA ligase family protein, partial [Anaerolineae bacterium]|nr:class I tRNA ligase family protein [Anaerolineae bacterium]